MSAYRPVVRSAALALAPLTDALSDRHTCSRLMVELGWNLEVSDDALAVINGALPVLESLRQLPDLVAAIDADPTDESALGALVEVLTDIIGALNALSSIDASKLSQLPGNLATAEAWADMAESLPDYLLSRWLAKEVPALHGALRLLGVCIRQPIGTTGRDRFVWDELGSALSDAGSTITESVGWNASFQNWPLQREIGLTLARLGCQVTVRPRQQAVADAIAGESVTTMSGVQTEAVLFGGKASSGLRAELGLVFACTPDGGGTIYIGNLASGDWTGTLDLGSGWSVETEGELDGTATMGILIKPTGLSLVGGSASLDASIALSGHPDTPWILLGTSTGTRLELQAARFELGVTGSADDPEAYALASVEDGDLQLILDLGEADGFLRNVIGETPTIEAGGTLRWSTRTGLSFSGGVGFEVTIPIDRDVGPLHVDELTVALGASESGARIQVTTTGEIEIGPLIATIENVGATLELIPNSGGDSLAGLDAELSFVPPTGLGLGVDAEGIVTGGGFLSFDSEEGRYAGVATLEMLTVGLTAVGIVETKVEGDPGWSLFICVVADFTPLPLGFGFFLTGVGGFMGLHRTFDPEALAEGVREGRIDSLLFPEDPLADATRILSDIEAYFPTLSEHHSFGAMARIEWGVPSIVSGELGVILTVPDYVVALVGEVESVLPDAQAAILELHMGVVGCVDVNEGTLWLAASIYDSYLAETSLSGDMSMYLTVADEPYFLLSIGGFDPGWSPPSSVPSSLTDLTRMSASIDLGDAFQAQLDAYFAVTSNTLQFGAEVWVVAQAKVLGFDCSAKGWFGFNTLIVFTPFSVTADMRAGVEVKVKDTTLLSIQLDVYVEGPKPWYANGQAEFTVWGFDVRFQVEVGSRVDDETAATIDVWSQLEDALAETTCWVAPDSGNSLSCVTVRELDSSESGLWLSPDGEIEVRQRVVPLDRDIEIFGAFDPSAETRFDVEAAGLVGGLETEWSVLQDWFAPAQYTEMSNTERMSAPSFEKMDAGATIGAGGFTAPQVEEDLAAVDVAYEEVVVEDDTRLLGVVALAEDRFGLGLNRPTVAGLRASARRSVSAETLTVAPTRYAVVDPLTAVTSAGAATAASAPVRNSGLTFADALRARRQLDGSNPRSTGRLRLVPTSAATGKVA